MHSYFPHLQSLSASSPFWAGRDTGYASNRALLFQQLPTAGLPHVFDAWEQLEGYVRDMTHTGVIDHFNEIRWDIRPAPHLGTLDMRVFDGASNLTEVLALAALTHCLVEHFSTMLDEGRELPRMPAWFLDGNKWRSARCGVGAVVILDAAVPPTSASDGWHAATPATSTPSSPPWWRSSKPAAPCSPAPIPAEFAPFDHRSPRRRGVR